MLNQEIETDHSLAGEFLIQNTECYQCWLDHMNYYQSRLLYEKLNLHIIIIITSRKVLDQCYWVLPIIVTSMQIILLHALWQIFWYSYCIFIRLNTITGTWICTLSGVSYLRADHSSVSVIPRVITNCAPDSIQTHIHTTFTHIWTINKSQLPVCWTDCTAMLTWLWLHDWHRHFW